MSRAVFRVSECREGGTAECSHVPVLWEDIPAALYPVPTIHRLTAVLRLNKALELCVQLQNAV